MRIHVQAKPKSHTEYVEEIAPNSYVVAVREPPEKGLANLAIRHALSKHLGIAQSRITLLSGGASKKKIFGIDE